VIRFEHLDLRQSADRQALLKQIEESAARLCEKETEAKRQECSAAAVATTLKSAPRLVRRAIATARLERDEELQAQR
jgi:hypothetical protein